MAVTTFTLKVNAKLHVGQTPRTTQLLLRTNFSGVINFPGPDGTYVPGGWRTLTAGAGEFDLPHTNITGAQPADFRHWAWLKVDLPGEEERVFGPFEIDAPVGTTEVWLNDCGPATNVPADWRDEFRDEVVAIAGKAQGALVDLAALVGGLAGVKNPGALVPWRLALANADTSAAKVVAIGDSITEGAIVSSWQKAWPHVLQDRLRGIAGVTGGIGYIAATTTTDAAVPALPLTSHGTPEMWIHGLGGRAMQLSTVEDHVTYASTPCTKVRVYYGKTTIAGGGLKVSIDGVDQGVTLLSQAVGGVVSGGHVWESPTLPMGSHVVKIEPSHTPYVGILEGVEFLNGETTAGVRVYNAAHYGGHTAAFTSAMMAASWQAVAAVEPDLVTILLGANDVFYLTTAQFLTNIDLMISKVPAGVPVLLLGCYLRGDRVDDPGEVAQWQDMQAGLRARAVGRVAYLDLAPHWPALASDGSTSAGLMAAGEIPPIHPSDAGAALIAKVVAAGVGPDTSAFQGPQGEPGPNTLPAKAAIDSLGAELIGEESELAGALNAAIGAGVAPVQAGLDAVPAKITTQVAARFGGARVIAFGDSLTSPDGGSPVGQGWVEHVKTRSEGRFALVRNAGIPGNTTTQMLARVQADVIAYTPQHVTFMGGTNDITAGASQATMRANVEGIWAAIKAAGATMSVLSIPPRSLADKKLSETARWNSWLRNFARREGLHFIDIHKHLVAPATGGFLSPYGNTDNLHFSREGAAKVGDVVLAELVPRLPLAGIDVPVHNVDPTNLIANGLLLAGTDSAPTGWSYNALAAGVTRGRVDDADFAGGKAWQTTVDGTQVADVTSQLSANAATGWAAGDRLRFVARFKVVSCDPISQTVGDAAGQKGLGVTALFYGAPSGAVRALVRYQSLAGHGGIAWADVTVPAGTTGPVQIALAVVMPAGKAGVFRQGQASILNLTEMGLP